MAPQAGTSYTNHNINPSSVTVGSDGANITWDFSGVVETSTTTSQYMAPASTPYETSFPGSNMSTYNASGGIYSYLNYNNSYYDMVGAYSPSGVVLYYSNNERIMTFPFTYNSVSNDDFVCDFVSGGYDFHRSGSVVMTCVGYGTLILPFGTYTNILKLKMEETYTDEYDVGTGPQIINYTSANYYWYTPGVPEPLFAITALTSSMAGTSEYAFYLDQNDITLYLNNFISDNNISIYPNPVIDKLTIEYNNEANKSIKYQIIDLRGSIVLEDVLYMNNEIDISNFSAGIYMLKLQTENEIKTYKIVKE